MGNDMKLTWVARCAGWLLCVATIIVVVALLDVNIDKVSPPKSGHVVEQVLFLGYIGRAVWGWLKRRLWIGTKGDLTK